MSEYIKAVIHDIRLEGITPYKDFTPNAVLTIDENTPVVGILSWINAVSEWVGYIDELHIMAHGIEKNGVGGYGVVFGKENILAENLWRWGSMAGSVDWIKLHACKIASGTSRGMTFCSQFAASTGAWLTASKGKQAYITDVVDGFIDFGGWEGKVCSWDPWGVQTQPYP